MRAVQVHQFQAFLTLAEELNYHRAAERLNLSQPGLSDQIRSLERYLGVTLFVRDRSGTRLTGTGKQLLPLAGAVVDSVNDLVQTAADASRPAAHRWARRLRVGLLADGLGDLTWQLLRLFNQARPDVEVTLTPLSFLEAFTAIDSNAADIVLCTGPASPSARQQVTTVGCEPIAAMMTRGNYLTDLEQVDLDVVARKLTFDTPAGIDPAFRRFWLQLDRRDRARAQVSTLLDPPDSPVIETVASRFGRKGAVGLWPARLPVDEVRTGCVVRPLDRALHAPRQVLSNRRSDHAECLLELAREAEVAEMCSACASTYG